MDTSLSKTVIVQKLQEIIDPELGVNVVDLGLIYGIYLEHDMIVVEYTVSLREAAPMEHLLYLALIFFHGFLMVRIIGDIVWWPMVWKNGSYGNMLVIQFFPGANSSS